MDDGCGEHMPADALGDRCEPPRGAADPVAQGGALDVHAVARDNARLAIERQPVDVFADDDVGDQRGAGAALSIGRSGAGAWRIISHARQLMRGRIWRITFSRAGSRSRTPQPRRHAGAFRWGHVLAELRQPSPATAWTLVAGMMEDLLTRQMPG